MMQQRRQQQPSMLGELSTLLMWICIAAVVISLVVWFNREPAPQQQPSLIDAQASLWWANAWSWVFLIGGGSAGMVIIVGAVALCIRFLSGALDHWKRPPVIYPKNGSNGVALKGYSGYDDEGHRVERFAALDLDSNNGVAISMNGAVDVQTFGHEDPRMRGMVQGQAIQQRHNTAREKQQAKTAFVSGQRAGKAQTKAEMHYDVDAQIKAEQLIREQAKTTKLLSKTDGKNAEEEKQLHAPIPPIQRAIEASEPDEWIMGANHNRQLAKFSPNANGHMAIFGTNGSGKTKSSAMMSVSYAKRFGWNVIVLDGKGGGDWRKLGNNGSVHYHTLTGDNIGHFIDTISIERARRMDELGEYESLHEAHGERQFLHMPKTLIVFEELGATILSSPKPKEVSQDLGSLMRLIRAAGLHLVIIEQSPDKDMLSNGIKANALYFTYALPGHQFRVVNATSDVMHLDQGMFQMHGENFQAWNVYEDAPINTPMDWPDLFCNVSKIDDLRSTLKGKRLVAYDYVLANPRESISEQVKGAECSDKYIKDARKLIGIS